MQIKESINSLLSLTVIPAILAYWFHTPLEVLLLSIVILLIWGSAIIRIWHARPHTEKNPATIRNFQIKISLGFSTTLLLLTLGNYISFFQGKTSTVVIWTIFSLAMLSLLGFIFMSLRQAHLEKVERSHSGSHPS